MSEILYDHLATVTCWFVGVATSLLLAIQGATWPGW